MAATLTARQARTNTATTSGNGISARFGGKVAGVGYFAIFFLAIFANFFVREGLIEAGDASATVANIRESEGMFRAGLIAFAAVFVIDIAVAWGIHLVFRATNHDLSLLGAWSRLVYTVFLGVAVVFFLMVLELIGGADYFGAFEAGQIDAQAMLLLDAFNFTWLIGLAAFGLHLIVMGYLVLKAGVAKKALGYFLIAAGVAYIVDTTANAALANYDDYADLFLAMVFIPSVVGEMWFGLWLLFRGGREEEHAA